jgi:hypothetical protein
LAEGRVLVPFLRRVGFNNKIKFHFSNRYNFHYFCYFILPVFLALVLLGWTFFGALDVSHFDETSK